MSRVQVTEALADRESVLRNFLTPDAALRRYLVEEEFLQRRDGQYWRCGGSAAG